jgi:N-acetylglucosaminyldiphosphoundecaprenol N-acetyl-beta-D-mannosaminyltransferase
MPLQEAAAVRRAHVLGLPVDLDTPETLRDWAKNAMCLPVGGQFVVTLNPEMALQALDNAAFGQIVQDAARVLPDGIGIVWALRRQGLDAQRLPGIEFAEALMRLCAEAGWPVAWVGGAPGVAHEAREKLAQKLPGLHVAVCHHGYFAPDEAAAQQLLEDIARAQPRVVLAALGSPRQEFFLQRLGPLLSPNHGCLLMGVGGTLDVWSGQVKRAPAWMQRLHLEWAWRLMRQPRRLGRILSMMPVFLYKIYWSSPAR